MKFDIEKDEKYSAFYLYDKSVLGLFEVGQNDIAIKKQKMVFVQIRDLHFVENQNPNTPMRVVSKISKQMEKEHFRILKMKIFMFFFLFLFYFWKIQKKNFIKMKN